MQPKITLPCRLCHVVDCNHRRVARAKAYDPENGAFITRPCNQCGGEYEARVRTLRLGMGLYCGKSCSNRSRRIPESERFWALVDRSAGPDACWPWLAAVDHSGHGLFSRDGRHQITASRMAWELTNGPLPPHLYACHDCPGGDNPICCNTRHMFSGTNGDNIRDSVKKGTHSSVNRHI